MARTRTSSDLLVDEVYALLDLFSEIPNHFIEAFLLETGDIPESTHLLNATRGSLPALSSLSSTTPPLLVTGAGSSLCFKFSSKAL